jgi:uncharacterized protein (DUF1810 family)
MTLLQVRRTLETGCLLVLAMDDPFDLKRFVDAQEPVYGQVCAELKRGRKTSHWIWFIFPQIAGLGHSPMAVRYAIASLDEARAYLEHPVLGARLRQCCDLLAAHEGKSIEEIMGWPDDLKLKSSMTLFARASANDAVFVRILEMFFGGAMDGATLERV